ncbi:type II toxin-antitoxin system VapC family toxin [Candidatus Bathyarchaeota archaeon]|nr:type II toxin-antitoxin system VapC family toxin [Candidatus Bathyarchaeota archaeon]
MRFIDSNIFIYHLAADPRYGGRASEIIGRVEEGEPAVTSTLVLIQVCSYLKVKRREDVIPLFLTFIRSMPNLLKAETTIVDLLSAMEIQTKQSLKWSLWDDLTIAAQMKRLGITEIYSNDRDFDTIQGVRRIF